MVIHPIVVETFLLEMTNVNLIVVLEEKSGDQSHWDSLSGNYEYTEVWASSSSKYLDIS